MGVAEYQLTQAIPKELKGELPSIEALEREMEKEIEIPKKPLDEKLSKLKQIIGQIKTDAVKKERDNESIVYLFREVLPAVVQKIEELLSEVIPEFKKSTSQID